MRESLILRRSPDSPPTRLNKGGIILMLKAFGNHVRGNVVGYVALFVALGGTAYAATGGNFILGHSNSASSKTSLSAPIADRALTVTNNSTKAGATALGLNVASGHPPFRVNSGA